MSIEQSPVDDSNNGQQFVARAEWRVLGSLDGPSPVSESWRVGMPNAMLRAELHAPHSWSAAGLIAWRHGYRHAWDRARQRLVVRGAELQPSIDGAYLEYRRGPWQAVLGTFQLGFGEGLVFDRTLRTAADGIYPLARLQLALPEGRLRSVKQLLGVAARYVVPTAQGGVWRITLALSHQPRSVYQYHFDYRTPKAVAGDCSQDSKCSGASDCASTQATCRGSPLSWLSGHGDVALSHAHLRDAYRESAWVGELKYRVGGFRMGWVAQALHNRWRLPNQADAAFREHAATPNGPWFGAFGAHLRWRSKHMLLAGAAAASWVGAAVPRLAPALRLRGEWRPVDALRLASLLYFYAPDFENPNARVSAHPDLALGLRARNEMGLRQSVHWRPSNRLSAGLWLRLSRPVVEPIGGRAPETARGLGGPSNRHTLRVEGVTFVSHRFDASQGVRVELRYVGGPLSDAQGLSAKQHRLRPAIMMRLGGRGRWRFSSSVAARWAWASDLGTPAELNAFCAAALSLVLPGEGRVQLATSLRWLGALGAGAAFGQGHLSPTLRLRYDQPFKQRLHVQAALGVYGDLREGVFSGPRMTASLGLGAEF